MNDKDHYHSFMLKFPDEYRNRPSHPPGSPPGSACSSIGLLRRSVGGYLAPRPLRAHPARLPRRRRPFPPRGREAAPFRHPVRPPGLRRFSRCPGRRQPLPHPFRPQIPAGLRPPHRILALRRRTGSPFARRAQPPDRTDSAGSRDPPHAEPGAQGAQPGAAHPALCLIVVPERRILFCFVWFFLATEPRCRFPGFPSLQTFITTFVGVGVPPLRISAPGSPMPSRSRSSGGTRLVPETNSQKFSEPGLYYKTFAGTKPAPPMRSLAYV